MQMRRRRGASDAPTRMHTEERSAEITVSFRKGSSADESMPRMTLLLGFAKHRWIRYLHEEIILRFNWNLQLLKKKMN